MHKAGRNDPCTCGSGKKYRKWPPKPSRLFRDILAFSRKHYGHTVDEAYEFFWDDFDPEERLDAHTRGLADINFRDWFVHDWRPEEEEEKTLIEATLHETLNGSF